MFSSTDPAVTRKTNNTVVPAHGIYDVADKDHARSQLAEAPLEELGHDHVDVLQDVLPIVISIQPAQLGKAGDQLRKPN